MVGRLQLVRAFVECSFRLDPAKHVTARWSGVGEHRSRERYLVCAVLERPSAACSATSSDASCVKRRADLAIVIAIVTQQIARIRCSSFGEPHECKFGSSGPGQRHQTPERETVTLLNTSPREINLSGRSLLDKAESKMPLSGKQAPGAALLVVVQAPMALSHKGGLITLVNGDGLKVDGVSYTKQQASNPGWTLVF